MKQKQCDRRTSRSADRGLASYSLRPGLTGAAVFFYGGEVMYIPNFGALESQAQAQVAKEERELRDWFAGQALIAIIGLQSDAEIDGECKDAYMYADQMLKAREQ